MFYIFSVESSNSRSEVVSKFSEKPVLHSQETPFFGRISIGWKDLESDTPKIKMSSPIVFRMYQGRSKFIENNVGTRIKVTIFPGLMLLLFFGYVFGLIFYSIFTTSWDLIGTPDFVGSLTINIIALILFFFMGMLVMSRVGSQLKKQIEEKLI